MNVLVTCPPMLRRMADFQKRFERAGISVVTPDVVQVLSVAELCALLPRFDGWIIGDDPANREVFAAGSSGILRAAVKWGVGVDNVDFAAARQLGIQVANTPQMFGREVADLAMCYLTMLARHVLEVDRGVRVGNWPKPTGTSLAGTSVALVGLGDIGRNVGRRLVAADMRVLGYDPGVTVAPPDVELARWPERIGEADFIVLACALTPASQHLLSEPIFRMLKPGVRVVNVSRGGLIHEAGLVAALEEGRVASAALDVYDVEPLPAGAALRRFPQCVFGSHNASNTLEAVRRTSELAIDLLFDFLKVAPEHG